MKIYDYILCSGSGNRFLLFDTLRSDLSGLNIAAFAAEELHRFGVDGLLLLTRDGRGRFGMRMFNTDGSEAEMCGNGIRCFARYLHDFGLTEKEEFTVETGAGILVPRLQLEAGKVTGVRVDMGEPVLEGEKIPVTGFGMNRVIEEDIEVKGKTYKMTCVSMGNPHCVIFVEDAEAFPIYELGASFESHPAFPRKTNTEFVEVRDRQHVRMRVWERGAAVTLACGTGSCATGVAGVLTGRTDRKVEVELDGGKLTVEWDEATNHVFMTGPAELVFTGEIAD